MIKDRRTLSFASLAEVMPEVDRLLPGHRVLGDWSLGQVCNHLTSGIVLSMDGFPKLAPWVIRKAVGPVVRRRILQSGRMPNGVKIPKEFEPRPELDARAEAEALRAAIRIFGSHYGSLAEHPLLGRLSHEEWKRFHTIHSAHHLSFVLPSEPASV
jgi:hypothetical protein